MQRAEGAGEDSWVAEEDENVGGSENLLTRLPVG